jgi:hypothetical protein
LAKLILIICAGLSGLSFLIFLLFTLVAVVMLVHAWMDHGLDFKDRLMMTTILGFTIAWGSLLTYLAGSFTVYCLT